MGAINDKSFLGTEPLGKLMVRLTIPTIIAELINLLYSIVDRIFLGHIPQVGTEALTGVGICLPLILLISAFSAFAGAGGAPLASISLGAKEEEKAQRILSNSVMLLLLFAASLMIIMFVFMDPLLRLVGASDVTLPFARDYFSIYLSGSIFVMAYMGLNPFVLGQGNSKRSLVAMAAGAGLNLILDPILIFVVGWGIKGAAIATIISQGVSAIITITYFFSPKSALRFSKKFEKPDLVIMKKILALGSSPFFMQGTDSIARMALNGTLNFYGGDLHVAAFTVLQTILQLLMVPAAGLPRGIAPIMGYNYGAQNFERVKATFNKMLAVAFSFEFVFSLLAMIFPAFFAGLFTSDTNVITLVQKTAPIFFAGQALFGIQVAVQSFFMATGQSKYAFTVAFSRKMIFLIPLAFILPYFFGAIGIYFAQCISDVLAVLLCIVLFGKNYKRLLSVEVLEKVKN